MVDTIYSASSRSSFKFVLAFGIVHHVLLQHLDFYSNHAMFFPAQIWVRDTWKFRLSFLLCIVYICACISFWLISFYLWLVLVFLFSKIYYGFTPLWHQTSRHYTSWQLSCSYAWPHTWRPVTSMLIMPLGLMYTLRLLYVIRLLYAIRCFRCFRVMVCLRFQLVNDYMKGQALPFSC
jgi:hypothetical protein